jgi:glycosyltransferase involved in cell wall biosynthesis
MLKHVHTNYSIEIRLNIIKIGNIHFVFCGKNVTPENKALMAKATRLKLHNVHFLGPRDDVERLTAGFDIAVLNSSAGEGFPNVIGEAMACGVPCVATDVGDTGHLIGDTGHVSPPNNPALMADACISLIKKGNEFRNQLGKKARLRIIDHFSIGSITKQYEQLYFKTYRTMRHPSVGV